MKSRVEKIANWGKTRGNYGLVVGLILFIE